MEITLEYVYPAKTVYISNERRSGVSSPGLLYNSKTGEVLELVTNKDAPQYLQMTRKESEKDSERPHYYSQFWLDVAAGRRIIGTPKTSEEGDLEEEMPIVHKPMRNGNASFSDGYHETIAHPDVELDLETDEVYAEPEFEDAEVEEAEEAELEPEEAEIPPLVVDEAEIPDMDFAPLEEEEVPEEEDEEEFFDEEEEEEDEDEIGWSAGRGRKKPKPGRQAKLPPKPPVKKPTKRRGF